MKHRLWISGTNPQPFRAPADPAGPLPVTVEELRSIGIAPRKIPRVQQELRRLSAADPSLRERRTVLKLARKIAAQLV